ncbi:UTRA domain-containing protein [Streptomyces sp. NPDC018693]|uniref:UTRA domain-containing protein n=1 Tax=unclassified Streptomyces TaxID=2593676 RepID=UPI00378F8E44
MGQHLMPYLTPREKEQPDAWGAEAAARGGKGGQRIVYAGEVAAPDEAAALLGLAPGETVVVCRRVIELDGDRCELTDTYYPAALARGTRLAEKRKIPGGAVTGAGGRDRPDARRAGAQGPADGPARAGPATHQRRLAE